jgi:hypothetical protein
MKHHALLLLSGLLASALIVGCGSAPAPAVTPIAPSEVYRVVDAGADVPADQVAALAVELTTRAELAGITGLRVLADADGHLAVSFEAPTAAADFRTLTQGARSVRMLAVGLDDPGGRIPPGAIELWTAVDVDPASVKLSDSDGNMTVGFALRAAAAARVENWTTAHIGEYVLLVVDGAPGDGIRVMQPIPGGQMALSDPGATASWAAGLTFGPDGYQLVPVVP